MPTPRAPHSTLLKSWCHRFSLLALAALGLTPAAMLRATPDANITKQVWRLKYGVTSTQLADANWLLADADGDGVSNGAEIAAGTNPFSPSTTIRVTSVTKNGANVDLVFPTQTGKRYQAQSTTTLSVPNSWGTITSTPSFVTGDGTSKTLTVAYAANTFYRILVDDLDTDGDGVSDWAETVAGLNPGAAQTTSGTNDVDYVNAQIALPDNTINIKAPAAIASKDGPTPGTFVITRSQKLLPQTIYIDNAGSTATPGTHYSTLPNTSGTKTAVTFAAGADTATLTILPLTNTGVTGSKSVKESLVAAAAGTPGFTMGPNSNATVIINDSTAATGSGLLGRYYDTSNSTYAHGANFGQDATYVFTRGTAPDQNQGRIDISYTGVDLSALQIGHIVRVSFNTAPSGSGLTSSTFSNIDYTVTDVNSGALTFAVQAVNPAGNFAVQTDTGSCSFSVRSFLHPPVLERVDPTVGFDWMSGTPNSVTISPNNSPDNFSSVWDTYLQPSVDETYTFQVDADDKAEIYLDINQDGTFQSNERILQFNWDDNLSTVGTFKQSAGIALLSGQRYKMRVNQVETTGNARCRLQWKNSQPTSVFANIPQGNQVTQTQAATYAFNSTTGIATVTLTGHGLSNGNSVTIWWANGNLFNQNASKTAGYSGTFTVANASANTFDLQMTAPYPATQSAGALCYLENRPASTTTGVFNRIYQNTTFANVGAPGRVGVDSAVTAVNNGIWDSGSPDYTLIQPDTFSVRWTGQVQPQYSEDYTFSVVADDGCALSLNGQPQVLKMYPTSNNGGSTYKYDSTTGNLTVTYTGQPLAFGSFATGEIVRLDPTGGALSHAPTNSPTYSYDGTTGIATIDYTNLTTAQPGGTVNAGTYQVNDVVELDPVTGNASALGQTPYKILSTPGGNTFTVNFGKGFTTGSGNVTISDNRNTPITGVYATASYSYTSSNGSTVVNYSAATGVTGTLNNGDVVGLDPISGNLNAVANSTYTISNVDNVAKTFTVTFPTTLNNSSGTLVIRSVPGTLTVPASATSAFIVNIGAGRYASTSNSSMNLDITTKALKDWSANSNERYVRIPMVAGQRYDIQLEYWEGTGAAKCQLYWYSASQPKQIIPSERLYPSGRVTDIVAPPSHVTSTDASGMVGGTFSQAIAGSNGATVTISGNPNWLTYSNGVLSGTPPAGSAGDYQVTITVQNSAGTSTSVLNLHIDQNTGAVARDYWTGISGTSISSIPTSTNPSGTENVTKLEPTTDLGDNYGERIRGYITAPVTGNYYFWVAANSPAEFWLSNDSEPINAFKRAWVTAGSGTPQNWSAETNQKSAWLALTQGQKYYFELLHKAGTGTDNLAVGWAKPGQATTAPSEVVPGYTLSTYTPPSVNSTPGTSYIATMLAQPGITSSGVGSSTLRISADETVAYMKYTASGLSSNISARHIHTDPYLTHSAGEIVYDIDAPVTPGDGLITNQSDPYYGWYKWTLMPVGDYTTTAQLLEAIREGKAYINIHTLNYGDGEIRGNYTLANGTRTFTAPPAAASWTDDSSNANAVVRFLTQATFGANIADVQALQAMAASGSTASKYEAWIDDQFTKTKTNHLPEVLAREVADVFGPFDVKITFDTWWKAAISAPDQLRQKVAFALSQIHVVSGQGPLEDNSRAISDFYDTLVDNAFGNFRDVLVGTTLTPGMGRYLDMLGNDKPDLSVGRSPNENYAREIKQLFSIGLYRMWPDGTLMLDSTDSPIATYTQREIVGLAHVFTGWYYGYDGEYRNSFSAPADWTRPMREVPARHFTGPKRVLNNEVLPGLTTVGGQPLDPYATHDSNVYSDANYQALPQQELDKVHDMLFNHSNTGPFICRQLIQRMVTSNPSRDYLYRVVQKFNDNGSGVRGDMKAVIKAILLDYEARSSALYTGATQNAAFGKQREPIQRIANAARALRPNAISGSYAQSAASNPYLITVTLSSPPPFIAGNVVFLEFTDATSGGAPAPTTGVYSVVGVSGNTFTISAPGWMFGTYNQTAGSNVMTITMSGHYLPGVNASQPSLPVANWGQAYFEFLSGSANGLANFDQTVRVVQTSTSFDTPSGAGNTSGSTFTITAPDTTARSGNLMIARFGGSYSCTGPGPNGVLTIDTAGNAGTFGGSQDHNLKVNDSVFLNFTNSRDTSSFNETSTQNDVVYSVQSVPDSNTFTVTPLSNPNAAMNSDNQVVIFPLQAQPITRNGTVNIRQGTYGMDNTDSDLAQTPLNSPTVFNFFLPDYKFPGALSSQGVTTPEFQLTAQTTAIRQANFIYNGIFQQTSTTGLSGFYNPTLSNANNLALILDYSRWMGTTSTNDGLGAPIQAGQGWTSDANLSTLIDHLNTLLLAGQLPASAKTTIQGFLAHRLFTTPFVNTGTACKITSAGHGLSTGDTVTISGVTGGTFSPTINGTYQITKVDANSFTVPVNCTSTTSPTALNTSSATIDLVSYTNSSPTATQQRDRLRNILHFILTSPDFTIQR